VRARHDDRRDRGTAGALALHDLPLGAGHRDPAQPGWKDRTEAQKLGSKAMQAKWERKRELAYNSGRHSFYALAEDPTFRDFICLYIGEGYKRSRNSVSLANSDPQIVELAYRWIRVLTRNKIVFHVQYHEDQNTRMLKEFWANRLDVSPDEIRLFPKSNSGRLSGRMWRCQFGVMSIKVGDTQLRARLDGWMDGVKKSWLDSPLRGVAQPGRAPRLGRGGIAGSNPVAPIIGLTSQDAAEVRE
jgi:hypothetical protein